MAESFFRFCQDDTLTNTPLQTPKSSDEIVPFRPVDQISSISDLLQSFRLGSLTPKPYANFGTTFTTAENKMDPELHRYVELIKSNSTLAHNGIQFGKDPRREEIKTAPLFSWTAKQAAVTRHQFSWPQYALLGHHIVSPAATDQQIDPIFINTDCPWSAFICGSQGSGKSYTLSCMLEGCLLKSAKIGKLPQPLTGVVFNYDSQARDVCEAAYLCSAGIKVTVLVSPSNQRNMERLYGRLPGAPANLRVKPLYLKSAHLNTERMMRLMAFGNQDSAPPLYMQTLIKTLRQMALESKGGTKFDYDEFKKRIMDENFTAFQAGPLGLRLDLLESFMESSLVEAPPMAPKQYNRYRPQSRNNMPPPTTKKLNITGPEILIGQPGELMIVDLTDPVIDSDSACVLFDICLAIFLEKTKCGKVVALDEAHNYMSKGVASENFTNNILKAVREQRHKGARIIVATQEPTISYKFLDLCSMTIVHRFNSPDWWRSLKNHLRGASSEAGITHEQLQNMFQTIGTLRTGESLLFAGSAVLDVDSAGMVQDLGSGHKRMKTRPRISDDGGKSLTATGNEYALPVENGAG